MGEEFLFAYYDHNELISKIKAAFKEEFKELRTL
jgi:hypothetical protein